MEKTLTLNEGAWLGCMTLICSFVTGFGIGLVTMFILLKLA